MPTLHYNIVIEHLSTDGMYMMEVDRVLRPGGYWVLSGPPINWRTNFAAWKRPRQELEEEQRKIEEIAELLCWEKQDELGDIAIWKKRTNYDLCRRQDIKPNLCEPSYPDDVWYWLNRNDNFEQRKYVACF